MKVQCSLLGLLIVLTLSSCSHVKSFKVLQFNIWQEGTVVENGYQAIVDEIAKSEADFVTLSEVRNYNNSRFCDRIVNDLKQKGLTYYSFYSYDSGILSRHPIIDSTTIFPEHNDQGSIYKAVVDMQGTEVAIYTAHLDYRNCALYLPRGYCGSTWKKLDRPITDLDTILYDNMASQRDDAIRLFLKDAENESQSGRIVIMGGDLNEPSHLDWTVATKDLYDHQGLIIPWNTTKLIEDAGLKDAYRDIYPNPLTHPGFTYPADCPHVPIKKLAWAPEADDRDRIDYIFYQPQDNLILKDITIVGPAGSIAYNKRVEQVTEDPIQKPISIWPTDHKALLAHFELIIE